MFKIENQPLGFNDKPGLIVFSVFLFLMFSLISPILTISRAEKSSNGGFVVAGSPAPDFSLPKLNGGSVNLSDYRGKVVFLNFWATWCVPCRKEMPAMEKLYQALNNEPFEILAVSLDSHGADVVAPFMDDYQLSFPALLDTKSNVRRLFNVNHIPQTFIIDKNGIIVKRIIGTRDWDEPEEIQYMRELVQKPAMKVWQTKNEGLN